uniref:Serine/threonine-protein kinase 1 n=1 Tax=Dendrocoelum lacteum TaxID=27895 RepID=T1D128_9PLAT
MDFQQLLSQDIEKIPHSESFEEFEAEYKCLQVIGEGGFGKVRSAIQLSDQRDVAIKFVSDKKITSWYYCQNQQKYIPMEISLMCRCREVAGVIKIIKYFQIKEHKGWYIIMERFERFVDLFDYITNQNHLKEKLAVDFMAQLMTIVKDCHRLGVCHRDIKDENIVINLDTMKIYLIDFGAGGFFHGGIYKDFDGTRVYSPPEWIQFKEYKVSSLEVWSLGILLYDMVCGNLPFDNDESIVNGIFHYRRPVTPSCQDLIQKCLQYDPCKRINMTEIIHHPWFTQYSHMNTIERVKRNPHLPCQLSSNLHNLSPASTTTSEDNSRRISLETSPFTTPQSSGLEDSDFINDNIQDSISSAPHQYLPSNKHNNPHNLHYNLSLTNFNQA